MPRVRARQGRNDTVYFIDLDDGGVAFVLSKQQLRIARVLLNYDEAVQTNLLYRSESPSASKRASISRSVRRLEELNMVERPGRGEVRLVEENREFLERTLCQLGLDDPS